MTKKINKDQYKKLVSLRILADKYWQKLEQIEESALEITGERKTRFGGFTFDYIYNDINLDDLLKVLKIEVEKTQKNS